jgi:hypothetical protein
MAFGPGDQNAETRWDEMSPSPRVVYMGELHLQTFPIVWTYTPDTHTKYSCTEDLVHKVFW